MESSLRIVAITNCPAGIAHTYMVAEALEQKARSLGHTIKVETQGSSGVENRLSSEEIAAADYVILATGRGLSGDDRARFAGKKVYEIAISQALKNIDQIFSELPTNSQLFAADSGVKLGKQEVQSGSVMSHLMAGVSAALPFVIGGGILVALANMLVQFGLPYTDMSKGAPSFTWVVESIGYLGFTFMIPIMGAYIASSIADKPAFAPAFLVCYLANDKALLGTQSGAGFLGAVVLGLAIGYFVFWFRKVRLGKALQPLLGSMLIPFVTLLVFGVLTYYVIGPVMSDLMGGLLHFLNTIPPSMKFAAAFLVGAMLAFDMGGPINKTAWFFCFSLLEKHIYDWYAIVGVVALMPPVAAGLATFIAPKLFTRQEKEAASSAIVVGATVATEPAIPYVLAAPLPMITANTLAGGITGVLVIAFGIKRLAPGLGIFDPLIGLMSPVGSFYLVLAIGLALNISFIIVLKGLWLRRKAKAAHRSLSMNIELLQQLCEASAVSGDEQEVRDILINTLEPCVNEITFDGLGSFVARKGNKGPKVAVVGHMDEVGFMVTHIDESGFLRFTTIGGWWNQSMLNHRVTIRTHKGFKIPGVIGSVAPHALTEKQKQQPLSFDEMFIDIGANSRDEVEKRGVAMGDFISPEANFACWGEDKVVGKALDNRIGCAMMAELLQTVNNPEITLYGVGSVEEEVGLRGAQTSAEHIKPDVVIVLDTAVAGDVPGIDNIKYPLKLGQGPGLMLFDKCYFPNQKLVAAFKNCATQNDLPLQFSTMKTGATDGGRYNVMGGGRPVVALCLPTRYLHANSGMISKADYDALLTLIRGFLTTLTAEKVNAFSQFRQVD